MKFLQVYIGKLSGSVFPLLIACFCLNSSSIAGEAFDNGIRESTTYSQISTASLEFLGQRIALESQLLIDPLQTELGYEDYVVGLSSSDYASLIEEFIQGMSDQRFFEVADDQFLKFYNAFASGISDDQFASIFRQFLGELTASYLESASSQDFTEYVLSRVLQLSERQYSNLYRDYIATLWGYFVTSATPEELAELLGDDYSNPISSAALTIEDEQYFYQLADHLTSISETEFLDNYSLYITEMIGGILMEPVPVEVDAESEVEIVPEAVPVIDSDTQASIEAEVQPAFIDLTTEESVGLIRRHIAFIAKSYFVTPFREDFVGSTLSYTNDSSPEQLALLLGLEDFSLLIQRKLAAKVENDQQLLNSLSTLTNDIFLGEVRLKLQFVENIPYPNMRLLRIAVMEVLGEFRLDSPGEGTKLPAAHFRILEDAVLGSASLHDETGLIAGLDVPTGDDAAATVESPIVRGGEIKWDFLGCGCEIDPPNIIYGFYPTWDVPTPGSPPLKVDLRFYDRVAYWGLSLNERGDISDDEYWREGGALNGFIQDAHIRNTRIDLGVYSPAWHMWDDPQISIAATNIVDKLSIPLQYGLLTDFASNYLVPIYPTYSETIGKNTMGDGLTLYFDNIEDEAGHVRNLDMIVRLISYLSNQLEREFSEDIPPINLMLDFEQENAKEVLEQLRPLILGTQANPDQYVARVLIFLEQDTWGSSQNLIDAVRTVFKDNDSAAVLRKLNPILVPAMDEPDGFPSLTRDLRDLRWTFGNAGGAAIWPIPLENSEKDILIEEAFTEAMVDDSEGFWLDVRQVARVIYFKARLSLIFSMTGIYLISMMILIWSIREPIKPVILWFAKAFGFITFALFMLSAIFIDPYINPWRIVFFLIPILFVLAIVPMQSDMPDVKVNITGNRYVKRKVKMQRSRALRGLKRKLRQGLWSGGES